jgi:hydrogenase maturation protein HypF
MESERWRMTVTGTVQGVGFRPFVYRTARELSLSGWVRNTPAGVELEVEGSDSALTTFLRSLQQSAPPLAVVEAVAHRPVPPLGDAGFVILASGGGSIDIQVAPDVDLCDDCLRELFDPADRRYRYPFITCTNCGPRYTIVTGIPYDRPLTTMAGFPLCDDCAREYHDPADRRFHAQPLACPACGPTLTLLDSGGGTVPGEPVAEAARCLKKGGIVAVKGTGGYHLAVDPFNAEAVQELRRRKRRDEKPFALLAADLAAAGRLVQLTTDAERLLTSREKPIVLLPRRPDCGVAQEVAPGNDWLGVMLPSTPLQHLLMAEGFDALVMTSANPSSEPMVYRDEEVAARLGGLADLILGHNRPIRVPCDDSVIRVFDGAPLFLRRARGYAPRAVTIPAIAETVLALGAELKAAVCLARGDRAFLSQHIGDLQGAATADLFDDTVRHLQGLLSLSPSVVAHDLHPDFHSSRYARQLEGVRRVAVQHHHAHLAACMAEHRLEGEVLGVIFDGTGLGPDGSVWGGEFLAGGYGGYRRLGRLRTVPLPGGDAAVQEPWRMALSWLTAAFGDEAPAWGRRLGLPLAEETLPLLTQMMAQGINSPPTSSCGRLFDAAAAILGVQQRVSYEGQAALELEALAEWAEAGTDTFPFDLNDRDGLLEPDFAPAMAALAQEAAAGTDRRRLARIFHRTVAAAAAACCGELARRTSLDRVVLSGGCFQNRLLSEELCRLLATEGLTVYSHRLVPPNDGGIALGQALVAAALCGE